VKSCEDKAKVRLTDKSADIFYLFSGFVGGELLYMGWILGKNSRNREHLLKLIYFYKIIGETTFKCHFRCLNVCSK